MSHCIASLSYFAAVLPEQVLPSDTSISMASPLGEFPAVVSCAEMAHALTAARLLLVIPFTLVMARSDAYHAALAAFALAVAIATDFLDGVIARRRGTASTAGRVFDHTTDCLFVTSGLAAAVSRGALPWILPALVAAAFVQYVVDSYWLHRGRSLRTSRLGRWNGILYFAPLGGDILIRLGVSGLQPVLTLLVWALVVSTVLSMGERLWAVTALRRGAPGSLASETGDPFRR
jgi:phosphatidylglycerophosphate synthase